MESALLGVPWPFLLPQILTLTKNNRRFAAIDKAIGKDGFKFVTLLRLSPLFPLAASNYL